MSLLRDLVRHRIIAWPVLTRLNHKSVSAKFPIHFLAASEQFHILYLTPMPAMALILISAAAGPAVSSFRIPNVIVHAATDRSVAYF